MNTYQSIFQTNLKDPVCGMTVDAQSPHHLMHESKSIYFCSASCKTKFIDNPNRYSSKNTEVEQSNAVVSEKAKFEKVDFVKKTPVGVATLAPIISRIDVIYTIHTCPMYSEVRQDHAGICPKWGLFQYIYMVRLKSECVDNMCDSAQSLK